MPPSLGRPPPQQWCTKSIAIMTTDGVQTAAAYPPSPPAPHRPHDLMNVSSAPM